jgi:hypothetical protein
VRPRQAADGLGVVSYIAHVSPREEDGEMAVATRRAKNPLPGDSITRPSTGVG